MDIIDFKAPVKDNDDIIPTKNILGRPTRYF